MGILAFSGRVMVAAIFLLSGVSKLTSYDSKTGNSMVTDVAPKMECFLNGVENAVSFDVPVDALKENCGQLILAAGVLEVVGGLLFVLDYSFGAILLMLLLLGVTPVMHNFWFPNCYENRAMEVIHFMKNLAIFGGLLAYTAKVGKYKKFKME